MRAVGRRDFLRWLGVGCVAGLLPGVAGTQSSEQDQDQEKEQREREAEKKRLATKTPTLMAIASKAAVAGDSLAESYFWRDDHTLLFLRLTPKKSVYHVVLVDTGTGRKDLLPAFNTKNSPRLRGQEVVVRIVGSRVQEHHYQPPVAALSPDGKWLLWGLDSERKWVAATLDGRRQHEWQRGRDAASEAPNIPTYPVWMPDSSGWIEMVSRYSGGMYTITHANLYSLDSASPPRTVRFSGLSDGLLTGLTNDNQVLLYYPRDPTDRTFPIISADFASARLDADSVTALKIALTIPDSTGIGEVVLSPQGDRLAWVLQTGEAEAAHHTLYVSQADGDEMRPIGWAPYVKLGAKYTWPNSLRWTPDGKRISFVYKSAVYTVPI